MVASDAEISIQPIISTTHGQVRGQLREGVYGDKYYCFDGIPYAKPPLGELRFSSPQPLETWDGVRDCTQVAPKCTQYNKYNDRIEGSEDCLFLNVYAKKLNSEIPLPVIVYIHGGGYSTGSASRLAWGPDYFMMKDVVLVTIGYRLGALGFLKLPEPELQVTGNAGLKDIVMALKWLKQNYQNFNGDQNNVTLAGHSSGSHAAHLLTLSPRCEGLFHKAVLLSGLSLQERKPKNLHLRFARHVGYEGREDNQQILEYLRSVEPEKLCRMNFLTEEEKSHNVLYLFCPCIENAIVPDAIITKEPVELCNDINNWSHHIPLLLGATSLESLVRYRIFSTTNPKLYDTLKEHPEYLLSYEVASRSNLATKQQLAKKLIKLHLGEKELIAENALDVIDLLSYDFIYRQIYRFLSSRLGHANAPTYLYRFDFDSPIFNLYRIKLCGRNVRGVGHVDDLGYIFYIPESFKLARASVEFKVILQMVSLLTGFAGNSDPNIEQIMPTIWEPVSPKGVPKCLNISNEIKCIDWPELEKCKIWDQYFKEAGLNLCSNYI